jgi:hypothetical protein
MEAKRKDITPFCLTVDKTGHDYLKTMCGDMSYEVRGDILGAAQHDIRDVPGLLTHPLEISRWWRPWVLS